MIINLKNTRGRQGKIKEKIILVKNKKGALGGIEN